MPFSCAAASPRAICTRIVDRFADGQRSIAQPLAQRLAFQQFGDNIRRALFLADVENRKNVGMVQRRRGSRFLREALQPVAISRERLPAEL